MNSFLLGIAIVTPLLLSIATVIFVMVLWSRSRDDSIRLMDSLRAEHKEQRINWEKERERLLNRAMVKEWTTYAQMTQAGNLTSDSEVNTGMSDIEEIKRAGLGHLLDTEGVGEVWIDQSAELEELGIR